MNFFSTDFSPVSVELAMKVLPLGSPIHKDRINHGIVMNGPGHHTVYTFSDGTVLDTKPYDLFYLPKGSSYVCSSLAKNYCMCINFQVANEYVGAPFCIAVKNRDRLMDLFSEANRQWAKPGDTRNYAVLSSLYAILYCAKRECESEYSSPKTKEYFTSALEVIASRYGSPDLSVEWLAKECGISVAYLRRVFHARGQMSPKEYVTRFRLKKAEQLLMASPLPIEAIAEACGYSTLSCFSRDFKRRYGISPTAYRKNAP